MADSRDAAVRVGLVNPTRPHTQHVRCDASHQSADATRLVCGVQSSFFHPKDNAQRSFVLTTMKESFGTYIPYRSPFSLGVPFIHLYTSK